VPSGTTLLALDSRVPTGQSLGSQTKPAGEVLYETGGTIEMEWPHRGLCRLFGLGVLIALFHRAVAQN
jgi:hypothetical protein